MTKKPRQLQSFQRAADAPNLPQNPFSFICYFVNQFRWWYAAIVILEVMHATSGIMLPYAIGEIIRSVTKSTGDNKHIFDTISQPLMLFTALSIGEVVFGRASGLLMTILHPIHRQHIIRSLYAYLQQHSHRYLSSSFAGALAQRISESALGVTQTMQMLISEFMSVIIVFTVATFLLYRAYPPLALLVGTWAVFFISCFGETREKYCYLNFVPNRVNDCKAFVERWIFLNREWYRKFFAQQVTFQESAFIS